MSSMIKSKSWSLDRYATYVPPPPSLTSCDENDEGKSGVWQHHVSKEDAILQLSIVDSEHLLVTSGNKVLESFTLWESQKWLKTIAKGDSIMFIYRNKKENRRFRLKLSPCAESTSSEVCQNVIATLAPFLLVQNIANSDGNNEYSGSLSQVVLCDSQDTQVDLTQSCDLADHDASDRLRHSADDVIATPTDMDTISTGELTQKLLTDTNLYENTQFPTQQLSSFIKLCLTDPNFPAFVEAVEKTLVELTEDT